MPSDISRSRSTPLITISCALVSYVHTLFGFLAFGGALVLALSLHYKKVVKNGVAGWPYEYWPSVSATIGDWYPERNIFQIFIALMSGPRLALVLLSSLLVSLSNPTSSRAKVLLAVGVLRTFSCGGWVYITSTDDHDVHDVCMIAYLVLTPAWMYISSGSLSLASPTSAAEHSSNAVTASAIATKARTMRRRAAFAFWSMIPFMILFFYRHKVQHIPGAYTHYSFFEWGLIVFDLLFDFASVYDLSRLELHVVEAAAPQRPAGPAERELGIPKLFGGSWVDGGTAAAVEKGAWSTPPQRLGGISAAQKSGYKSKSSSRDQDPVEASALRDIISLLAETYIGFCFWTTLTALHPTIFFFSVYNLAVGGHEVLLVSQVFALGFCLLPFVRRRLLVEPKYQSASVACVGSTALGAEVTLRTLSLVGMGCWWIANPLARLMLTAVGAMGFAVHSTLDWAAAWEREELQRKVTVWLLGLFLSSFAKYANHSNNPAWPFMNQTNGGLNGVALSLAVLANVEQLYVHVVARQAKLAPLRNRAAPQSWLSTVAAAVSAGSLIYSLHTYITDSGTMISWTWTGWPVTGPMAIPHGVFVLGASLVSLMLSLAIPDLGSHILWFFLGAFGSYQLLTASDWDAFLGAIAVAVFLPPIALPILTNAMQHHPLKIMLGAWLTADLMTFFQTLTVAYAFVPGGKPFREHSDAMMVAQLAMLLAGMTGLRMSQPSAAPRTRASLEVLSRKGTRLFKYTGAVVLAIAAAAAVISSVRLVPANSVQPYRPQERILTAGIWTVHFALDQNLYESSRRMSTLIGDMELDVVGLLESDLQRSVFGNRDLTQYLAQSLGMYADIGPGPDKHTWGATLLSKFPIVNTTHHLLPSPHGELAPAIHAVLDVYGVHTHVIVSHNGQEEDPLDRELQTTELARILREAYPHPAIFLGYVVTKPHADRPAPYKILFEDGKILDVHPGDGERWCQYLGFRGLDRIGYVRVSRYTVTDTELQVIKLRVPEVGQVIDPDTDSRSRITSDDALPKEWRFPHKFIDPPAMVYNKHKYSPFYFPLAFVP
ncbi:hypothetical protein IE81DRAFT_323604 [Ceraceosorus guamensis]|uniref:Calcofluor white hypersensitive protein n=1 Tax=Ceraceosorus guamensis TaxID=1522189 RepID=A0A316W146_9BASI|nr:hypothetical protein IE81DRAFT_323604 [Ceraceosorus guamensis]PWN42281.1 hypothetical protein IE81DRAFT_323604 [Ceraceosorus guamensis]